MQARALFNADGIPRCRGNHDLEEIALYLITDQNTGVVHSFCQECADIFRGGANEPLAPGFSP